MEEEEPSSITWDEMRKMSDDELRALREAGLIDDEPMTVEEFHDEIARRERNRLLRHIRVLLMIMTLCLLVIAIYLLSGLWQYITYYSTWGNF